MAIVLAGCAATAPDIHVIKALPKGVDPALYVTAARQKEQITHALRGAGFHVVEAAVEGAYLLRVTVGVDQGWHSCGTFNNVRYALRTEGRNLVVVEAKGWTGTCKPNVFDGVSRELRKRVIEMTGEGGQ